MLKYFLLSQLNMHAETISIIVNFEAGLSVFWPIAYNGDCFKIIIIIFAILLGDAIAAKNPSASLNLNASCKCPRSTVI